MTLHLKSANLTSMEPIEPTVPTGAFLATLTRNNKQIRSDRALAISEDAQTLYKRQIEDMQMEIKRLARERTSMLDLSPTDSTSLKLASDFNAQDFVSKDIEIGVKMRNLGIKLEIAQESYTKLFGA